MSFIIGSADSSYYAVESSLVAIIEDRHFAEKSGAKGLEDRYTSMTPKDKITSKVIKSSLFDRLCWIPGLSTLTGGIRALAAIFHLLLNGIKLAWHSTWGSKLYQNKKEIAFGFHQLGLGVLEAIPFIGNLAAYLLYRRRKAKIQAHAKQALRRLIPIGKHPEEKEKYARLVQKRIAELSDESIEKKRLYDEPLFQQIQEPEKFQKWLDESEGDHVSAKGVVKELTRLYKPTYFLHAIFTYHADATEKSHTETDIISL